MEHKGGGAGIDRVIALEALTQLFSRIRKEVITNMIVPAMVILVMWSKVDHNIVVAWGVMMLIGIWANYFIAVEFFKQPEEAVEPVKWGRRMSGVMFYFALLWIYAIVFFYVNDSIGHQVFLSTIVIVFGLGSIMVGIYWFPMYYLLAIPIMTTLAIRMIMNGTVEYISLAALVLWTMSMTWFMAKSLNKTVWNEMRLRHHSSGLVDELNAKTADAERANVSKSKFLAAASHDLRQPLHALMLNATILEERNQDTKDTPVISNIISSVRSMESLFSSILDISKLDAGVIDPDNIHFKLQPVLDKLFVDCEYLAAEKNLELDIPKSDLVIFSNPAFLERVLRNIIFNAIQYTNDGYVSLTIEQEEDMVHFKVIDTGIGICEDQVDIIFDEFVQLDNPERDRSKGLGLGLSIVKRLCKLMDTSVQVESSPDKGSVFSFALPLGDDELAFNVLDETSEAIFNPLKHFIVVIDDDKSSREGLASLLESWSCTVKAYGSENEALYELKEYAYAPDVLLVDYRLRDNTTGIEAIAAINELFGEEIPALIITGDTASERLKEVEDNGYRLLHKPLHPPQLRSFLQKLPS